VLDMFQAVAVMRPEWPNDIIRKLALTRQLVEPRDRRLDRLAPSGKFLLPVGVALSTPRMGKAEPTDHSGQHQALSNQGHQYDGKGEEEDQVSLRKRLAVVRCKRYPERRHERDDASDAGKGQRSWPLPRR